MPEEKSLPHKLEMQGRKHLTMTGVAEVVSFDDTAVALKTSLGLLSVHGQGLQLKNLSLEGGQVEIDGHITALVYQQERQATGLRRLFQ